MTRPTDRIAEYESAPTPTVEEQAAFWDRWNKECRFREDESPFQIRQREVAVAVAKQKGLKDARILDVGCGVGWLGAGLTPFGKVIGTDLSPLAVEEAQRRYPLLDRTVSGDFMTLDFGEPFDFIVCADTLCNIKDAAGAVAKIARLLKPGGTFVLIMPNRKVWEHRSTLERVNSGQFMHWPPLSQIRSWLRPHFTIERIGSVHPGGDIGALWWVENRYVEKVMRRLLGSRRWRSLLEAARLGRSWTIIAKTNAG